MPNRSRKLARGARSYSIQIRFTDEERRAILVAARLAGLPFGTWLRFVAMQEARRVAATHTAPQAAETRS